MKKKFFYVLCFFSMILMLSLSDYASAEDTIKIADFEPLSGTFKDIGERYVDGVRFAAETINKSGGLLGKKVEVIPIDSEFKPDVSARKAENLRLKEGVMFFCGGSGSSVGAALSQFAARQNVLFYTFGMEAATMTGKDCNKNFFRPCLNTDQHSSALAVLTARGGFRRIAIIAQDYSFGHEAVEAFKKKLKQVSLRAKIVVELFHPVGTKDFAPYASQVIAAKPDIIFTPNWGNDLTLLLKQGRPMGMTQRIFSYFINDEILIEAIGNDSLVIGSMSAEPYSLSIPTQKNRNFLARFYEDRKYYPSGGGGSAYIATMFWAEAVKKAKTTNIAAVIKAWEGLSYDGPAGIWTMRACDHQAQLPIWFMEINANNSFYKHAFGTYVGITNARSVEVPCARTGCWMKR
jgi:branched-chain amino acid transport system substrate-binding protein